jgi:hypothetical protein
MKNQLFWILFFPFFAFSQQGIEFFGTYNQPLATSFVNDIAHYKQAGHKTNLSNFIAGVNVLLYKQKKFNIRAGLTYKYLTLNVTDVLDSMSYTVANQGSAPPDGQPHHAEWIKKYAYYYKDKPDYNQRSHSLGVNLDFRYSFFEKNKIKQEIGAVTNVYFFEHYASSYITNDQGKMARTDEYATGGGPITTTFEDVVPLNQYKFTLHHLFFLSSVDLNLFYQFNWIISPNFSLGLRASIGTNLYSDWNQFKKYLWAGFGLHVGFLKDEKVRLNKKELGVI